MRYNVPLYFERKNIKSSDIFYLTRQNPHTIITLSSGESITTTIPIKELMLYLPEEDFQYCCLYLLGFDTNTEAKLLNIATNSVSRKRSRLKQKLNITLPTNFSLYEYLIKNMH